MNLKRKVSAPVEFDLVAALAQQAKARRLMEEGDIVGAMAAQARARQIVGATK